MYYIAVDCIDILYTCCRDGKARKNTCPRKTSETRKNSKSSRKLGSYCLARMFVKHHPLTGKVDVIYNSTHTNHSLGVEECKYIPLPVSVRKEIQEKFAQGITLERIMDGNEDLFSFRSINTAIQLVRCRHSKSHRVLVTSHRILANL